MPERTCVGCRRRRAAVELIRCQARDGRLVVVERPEAGRSAYLCPDAACLEQARKRRAFARALRAAVEMDDGFVSAFEGALMARKAVR
jgi:uncharacterized protein